MKDEPTDNEIEIAKSDKVKGKVDKIIEKAEKKKHWKRAHNTEDLIKHGEEKLKGIELPTHEKYQFHSFGVEMLKFEHQGQVTGDKGYIMLMMRKTAKNHAIRLRIRTTRGIIRAVKADYAAYDKTTLEGFYYKTISRYLKIVSVR